MKTSSSAWRRRWFFAPTFNALGKYEKKLCESGGKFYGFLGIAY